MKKIFGLIFLLISAIVSAQNNAVEDTTAKPAITEIGKPDGENTKMKIGKKGGSLTSSDGKVRLIIPAGAVSKNTTFNIQPTTNLMPNGNGKAYKMEPSGINFQQPLQIIFYYTDTEIEGNSPGLLAIATQDDKGQWSSLNKLTTDTVAKTLTAETWHFSTFVSYFSAEISPSSARVKVNGSLRLRIIGITSYTEGKVYENGKEVPLKVRTESAEIWSVNGIPKGNGTVGLISASQNYTAIFQAPAQVPSQNPVAVTVQENFYGVASRKWDVYTLVSNILVYDNAYEVTMVCSMNGGAGTQLGNVTYKDMGSFVVSLNGIDSKIIEKVNKNANAELGYNGKCTVTTLKAGSGNIHIIGTSMIKTTQPSLTKSTWVEIEFQRTPTIMPLLQFICPYPGKGGPITSTNARENAVMALIPAFPQRIRFEAKEGEQIIYKIGEEGSDLFVRFTVKQLKDD